MEGDCPKLRHGEILNPDGSLYTVNLRKAKAEIVCHKGNGIYRPRFTYMGFRYAELSGVDCAEGHIAVNRKTQTRYPKESLTYLGQMLQNDKG